MSMRKAQKEQGENKMQSETSSIYGWVEGLGGFWGLGFKGLRVLGLGFRGLGFRGLGFRV